MDIEGRNVLVLGGRGLVGLAVSRALLAQRPGLLVVTSRQQSTARLAAERLNAEFPDTPTRILPTWGDVFLRADWQGDDAPSRASALEDPARRRGLIADILDPLTDDIVDASMLTRMIRGTSPGLDGSSADIVVDCMNTATAVAYQDIYGSAQDLADLTASAGAEWPSKEAEILLASLYIPLLVRHVQLLYEAMRRAGTRAYIKVGTTGTGGMGFNIPYTHGEEKPSRLLMSKAAVAGAQTMLTFLMARTPGRPEIVKEIKPAALIGWREISHGPIGRFGREMTIYDCPPEAAVSIREAANLVASGDFGVSVGQGLDGVYIDTGENGLFSADEFAAITALGQMQLVTPEEIARTVIAELKGGNTGHDVIASLDGSVMGPSYRGGYLRQAALDRLRQLEAEHGESVAFEILGPPRLSKLLFEAFLLKRAYVTMAAALEPAPDALAGAVEQEVIGSPETRRRIISIGIPILLADGERLLRGPVIKSLDAYHGWVDLTPANMGKWQGRLDAIRRTVGIELGADTSSRHDRTYPASRQWLSGGDAFDIGEIVAWVLNNEDQGSRAKG